MSVQIPLERLKPTLLEFIDETFSHVHGMYLDKGTTLYDTLDGVTAEEASRAASRSSPTLPIISVEFVRRWELSGRWRAGSLVHKPPQLHADRKTNRDERGDE